MLGEGDHRGGWTTLRDGELVTENVMEAKFGYPDKQS